jgi:acyl-CoA thioesterase I
MATFPLISPKVPFRFWRAAVIAYRTLNIWRTGAMTFKEMWRKEMAFVTRVVVTTLAALWFALGFASGAAAQVVAIGDSGTTGFGVASNEAYPAKLEALLRAKGYNVTVRSDGIIGDPSANILARLDAAIVPGTKVVILQMGYYNDWRTGVSREQNAANVKAAMAKIRAHGANYVWINDGTYAAIPRSDYGGDGLHLNEQGHALLAARILPQVIRALGAKR